MQLRRQHSASEQELRKLLPAGADPRLGNLDERLDDYWQAFEPLFEWSMYEKMVRSGRFLRREVLPRREAVLAITRDIEQLNNANLAMQRGEVTRRLVTFREDLHRRLWRTLLLGALVAIVAVIRLRMLELRSRQQRAQAERAENEMRLLSQQLVAAQEEERKKLTRELHDHVGQMLTALRMEIGRAERVRGSSDEAKRLIDTILRSVRDLVMGLRPSMLDDFGLQPALEWLVRDYRRRFTTPIDLTLAGEIDLLPDQYRTAIYRIVQEALTNCARHAHAKRIEISLHFERNTLELTVSDDGGGIELGRGRGMGLIGIEERVRELQGTFDVRRRKPSGTELHVVVPVSLPMEEVPRARAAG